MDNQIFPTGPFLDELPQVCTLCGMLFNNSISLQHHMQLHILSATANQLLGNQPPDPGLTLNPAPNILDLVAGTSQHVVPGVAGAQHVASGAGHVVVPGSSANNPLITAQALFTANAVATVPSHLIPQSIGNASSTLPQKSEKRKSRTATSKAPPLSMSAGISTSTSASVRSSNPSTARSKSSRIQHQSRDNSISTYISTFPDDLQKMDLTPPPAKCAGQSSSSKEDVEPFLPSLSQIDPIEEALKVPAFSKVSQFDRPNSSTVLSSSRESQNKDPKLFQPFVTVEEPPGLSFMSKSNTLFTADSLLSPVKNPPDKPVDLDVLSTPQKPSYSSLKGSESLSSSPKPLPNVPITSDLRHFARGKSQDSAEFNLLGEKLKDMPQSKVSQSSVDNTPAKPQFYPGLIDPMNISPKSSHSYRDSKSVNVPAKVLQAPSYNSSSPDLKTNISIANEPPGVPKDPTVPMLSPKVSVEIASTSAATSSATAASKPSGFGNGDDAPTVFGSSKSATQVSSGPGPLNPAIGMTDVTNPLGTGYFNALTQKLLNPGLSIGSDFNKPNTSSFNYGNDSQGQKGKSYYENGILINQDYDKISDSGGEEDLEKLIDDIDTKDDNIDTKGYAACSEIEDLLNEFNEKHPEDLSKNKSQMDDFLNDVLNENIRMKLDERTEDPVVPSAEDMAMNQLAISELLEKEKEKIDKESKMMESARLSEPSGIGSSKDEEEEEDEDSMIMAITQSSATTTAATANATATTSQPQGAEPSTSAAKSDNTEDDHTDFDIPKVGKLMKIRKYFQIQEQKKKEKTQIELKDAEVKIQIREKEPVAEIKPQTVLVQVSKRKKIEYGPYINRQSLLEGKPKEAEQTETAQPPKVFRPKPKPPQSPTKRTFNLRTRKTKTDFASLANKGSKTPDVKKTNEKAKDEKNKASPDEEAKEETEEAPVEESETAETGITTRTKDKIKIKEAEISPTPTVKVARKGKDTPSKSDHETDHKTDPIKKEDGKPNLRTRSSKVENEENVTETKNLRKRTSKSPADGSKTKVVKTDTKCTKADQEQKGAKTEENNIRISLRSKDVKDSKETKDTKDVKKKSPEKTEIKMCSVNLGENLTELKIKAATSKKGKFRQAVYKRDEKKATTRVAENNKSEGTNEKKSASKKNENIEIDSENTEVKSGQNDTGGVKKDDDNVDKHAAESQSISNEVDTHISKDLTTDVDKADVKIDTSENADTRTSKLPKTDNEKSELLETLSEDKPQLTVRKDKPRVTVGKDKPQVTVSKDKPQLTVNTDKPQLTVNEDKPQETVSEDKPPITVGEDKPQVAISRDKPQVVSIEKSASVAEDESEMPKQEPVREKLTMKFKLGASLASIIKEHAKHKRRKLAHSPHFEDLAMKLEDIESQVERIKSKVQSIEKEEKPRARESIVAGDSPDGFVFESLEKMDTKPKHSVENEFQRLVDEAMAEVKNAPKNDSGKQERYTNLRKRLNDGVKYNVDDSDDELDHPRPEFMLHANLIKAGKCGPKGLNPLVKGPIKAINKVPVYMQDAKPKKDMDIYDFTDTELSDKEDSAPSKLSFKPKYVSNLKMFSQNKIPFVSKPITPPSAGNTDSETRAERDGNNENDEENDQNEGLTVQPLKIKLSTIIPYKERRHKHKKKRRKKDRERKQDNEGDEDRYLECEVDDSKNMEMMTIDSDSNEGQDENLVDISVQRHAKRPKFREKKHICVFCNQGFGQKCDLRKHVMIHTGERPWPCEICDKKFQRKTDLVKHTRTHTGEKPYACEFCDKRVSDKSQLSVHRRLHTGDRPYQCTKCGKRCITSSELTRHRSVRCSEKAHQCELCKKTFKIKECLGMHMKMHYRSKGKLFQCDRCAIGFDKKTDIDNHSCANWNNAMYICSECYEEFSDELVYAEHIKTHDLGVFSCNMCTKIFEDKHSLETHLCGMGIEMLRPYQCEICDDVFHDQNSLSQHVAIHDNDLGSFMCELCPEIFSIRRDLMSHVRAHKDGSNFDTATDNGRGQGCLLKGLKDEVIDVDLLDPSVLGSIRSGSVRGERGIVERASVISNTFRQVDTGGLSKKNYHSAVSGLSLKLQKTSGKTDVLNSDKIFEASDFTNSPDFSSLTEEADLSMNPFEKLGAASESQIPGHAVNRKVNSSFGGAENQRENIGFGGSLGHSMKELAKSSKSYPSVTSQLPGPADSAQTSQEYSWTGSYQISANEYVDSLLSRMGPSQASNPSSTDLPSKPSSVKSETHESGTSKTGILSPSSRGDLYKDNIENRSKSYFFSEFDFQIGQKPDTFQASSPTKGLSQQKFSNNSGARENTAFQGIDQNSYNLSRNRHFPESSPFSNSFMTSFQQNNSIYNSGSSNLFGSDSADLINKRGNSSGIFGENQDMLQNSFYLGVEEPLKGTSPSDKTDETTALLSNFDYGIN